MAVTQESRYRMHQRLEEVLGHEPATTLMEHLPPTGWADLATKQDLGHAGELTSQRIDALDDRVSARIDALDERVSARIDALDERVSARIDALDHKFMSALAVEASSIRTEIAKSRGDMYKLMIMQIVGFLAVNVALASFLLEAMRRT